jgi:hypothetical protein
MDVMAKENKAWQTFSQRFPAKTIVNGGIMMVNPTPIPAISGSASTAPFE